MKELLKSIEVLTAEELARSYEKFPKFNSPHEGYAVIKEEVEEHADDIENVVHDLEQLWNYTKTNDSLMQVSYAENLRDSAIHAAAEAIHVAAMAQKYIDSLGGDNHEQI